jgi:hypothetical protein
MAVSAGTYKPHIEADESTPRKVPKFEEEITDENCNRSKTPSKFNPCV